MKRVAAYDKRLTPFGIWCLEFGAYFSLLYLNFGILPKFEEYVKINEAGSNLTRLCLIFKNMNFGHY